jgi:hypothetical protein
MSRTQPTWREQIQNSAADTTHTQSSERVKPGEEWYAARVAVKDATTASAVCDLSIDSGGNPTHVHRFAAGSLGVFSDAQIEVWLREGECLRCDWSAVVAGDVLHTHIVGVKRLPPERPRG